MNSVAAILALLQGRTERKGTHADALVACHHVGTAACINMRELRGWRAKRAGLALAIRAVVGDLSGMTPGRTLLY